MIKIILTVTIAILYGYLVCLIWNPAKPRYFLINYSHGSNLFHGTGSFTVKVINGKDLDLLYCRKHTKEKMPNSTVVINSFQEITEKQFKQWNIDYPITPPVEAQEKDKEGMLNQPK